jgi:membrane protease YdiL (CAAX protease family)
MDQRETPIERPPAAPQQTSRGRIIAALVLCFLAALGLAVNQIASERLSGAITMVRDAQGQQYFFQGKVVLGLAYYLEGMRREVAPGGATARFARSSVRTGFESAAVYFERAARNLADADAMTAAAASAAALYGYLGDDWRAVVTLQRAMEGGRQDILLFLVRLYANQRPTPGWLKSGEFRWTARHAPAHLLIESEINRRMGRRSRAAELWREMLAAGSPVAVRVEFLLCLIVAVIFAGALILARGIAARGFGPYRGLPPRPWGPWEGLELVGVWLVLMLVIAQFAGFGMFLGIAGLVAGILASYVIASLVALMWFARSVAPAGSGLSTAGWRPVGLRHSVLNGIGACAAALPPGAVAMVIAMQAINRGWLTEPPANPLIAAMMQTRDWGTRALFLTLLCVAAPVVEETIFRGGLYAGLRRRWSLPAAALISSAVFAAVHLNWASFLPVTALGVALCVVYERTGSLLPAMVAHGIFNLVTAVAVFALA